MVVINRAFRIAAELREQCRPVHLLVALAEVAGPIGEALVSLRREPAPAEPLDGASSSFLFGQVQQMARQVADERREPATPGHYLLALIDQADAEVLTALGDANIAVPALRQVALRLAGAPWDLPRIAPAPLTPAGTMDRPPLEVDQLETRVWRVLGWRQDHLPLDRIHRVANWHAVLGLESRTAWKLADRAEVDDDQRYSLLTHHCREVERRVRAAHPSMLPPPRDPALTGGPVTVIGWIGRPRRRRVVPNFMVGWPCWFDNRRADLRDASFRATTWSSYRGQPKLGEPIPSS